MGGLLGLAFRASGMLRILPLIGGILLPLAIAGGVAWFWSIASSAGRAQAEVAALAAVNEANREAAARARAGQAELSAIAREAAAQAKTRTERIAALEASLAEARAASPTVVETEPREHETCPTRCVLPPVNWPWSDD